MSDFSDHVARLLGDESIYGRFLANARRWMPASIHGITAADVVQEAVFYIWRRALECPESFAGKSDHQIIGLTYQRISSYSIDQIRRGKSGAAKMALIANTAEAAADPFGELSDQLSGQTDTAQDLVREVFPLIEQLFEFPIGVSRFITMVEDRVGRSQLDLNGDAATVRKQLLELLATTLPTWRLAPATKAKPPTPRQALLRLAAMLIDGQPITEASTGLPIRDIVRGLDHIWKTAVRVVRKDAPPDSTPAKALVLAGVAQSADVARQLLDTYVKGGADPLAAFDESDTIIAGSKGRP
jgi:hypothetical protein